MPTLRKTVRTYQNIIVSSVIIFFCVIAAVAALFPAVKKVQETVAELSNLSGQNTMFKKKSETLMLLDEDALRSKLTQVLSAVPADRSFPTIFETVERVAAQTGVTVSDMTFVGETTLATPSSTKVSATEKKIGTRTVALTVTISGTLEAVEQFISMIPSVRRLFRVKTFSMTFPREVRPLTVSIDMDAFYEPLPETIGKAQSTLPVLSADDEAVISRLSQLPLVTSSDVSLPPPSIGTVKDNPFIP